MLNFFRESTDPEMVRTKFFVFYGSFGFLAFSIYSAINFILGDTVAGIFELILALFSLFLTFLTIKTKSPFWGETLGIIPLLFISINNFVNGGFLDTGIYWTYVVPLVAIFLCGIRKGTIIGLTFVAATALYYYGGTFFGYIPRYNSWQYYTYLASFLSVLFMSILFQQAWNQSQGIIRSQRDRVEKIKQKLEEKVTELEKTKANLENSLNVINKTHEQLQKQTDVLINRELRMAELKDEITKLKA